MDRTELAGIIECVGLGAEQGHGRLRVIPLVAKKDIQAKYVLLDAAISRGRLAITEVNEGGSVPYLKAVNQGPWPVLIFDGEELVGAKQNRIVNATVLVDVGVSVLPVSCVEAGRWSARSARFSAGSFATHPGMRREKEQQVRASTRDDRRLRVDAPQADRAAAYMADQGAVWAGVDRDSASLNVNSATQALHDAYVDRKGEMELSTAGIEAGEGMVGAAVFLDGRLLCLDALWPSKRFGQFFPKLLQGYAFQALTQSPRRGRGTDPESATLRLLGQLLQSDVTTKPSIDLGEDVRLETSGYMGSGLAWNGRLLQLSLFPRI